MNEQEKYEMEKHDRERHIQRRKLKQNRIRQIRKMRIWVYTVLIIGLVLGAFGVYAFLSNSSKKSNAESPTKQAEEVKEQGTKVEDIYEEPEINIVMVGDILLHEPVQESGKLAD